MTFRWSLIAGRLPGRTDNEVKNYWNSHIKKKLMNMGIDPNNHKLSQTLALPREKNITSTTDDTFSRSSTVNVDACVGKTPLKSSAEIGQKVSADDASCLEDETSGDLSHAAGQLNLDLTISFPSSQSSTFLKEHRVQIDQPVNCRDVDLGGSAATLLLFQ